jgi:hypothetical protein
MKLGVSGKIRGADLGSVMLRWACSVSSLVDSNLVELGHGDIKVGVFDSEYLFVLLVAVEITVAETTAERAVCVTRLHSGAIAWESPWLHD